MIKKGELNRNIATHNDVKSVITEVLDIQEMGAINKGGQFPKNQYPFSYQYSLVKSDTKLNTCQSSHRSSITEGAYDEEKLTASIPNWYGRVYLL